jgi:hypothetical protein
VLLVGGLVITHLPVFLLVLGIVMLVKILRPHGRCGPREWERSRPVGRW